MNGGGGERKGGGEKRGMLMFLRRFKEREAGSFVLRIIASANHSDTHLNLQKKEKKENKKKLSLHYKLTTKLMGKTIKKTIHARYSSTNFCTPEGSAAAAFFFGILIFCDANL